MSFIANIIKKHWTIVPVVKSPEQLEREKYLCLAAKCLPFNRWVLFVAAFMIQFCCGSLYSWSVFNTPIDTLVFKDPLASKAVNSFYMAVVFFGFTAMLMGPWLERNGPRKGVLLGSTMFLVGKSIAAISLHYKAIEGIYIGYGIFCGFGLGLNYICPVSALQKWFPDYRGVASGFAVGGFGAGSVVWAQVYLPLVTRVGLPQTFAIIGSMFFVVMILCSVLLRTPPPDFAAKMAAKMGTAVPVATAATTAQKDETEKNAQGMAYELDNISLEDQIAAPQKPDIEAQAPTGADVPIVERSYTLIESICTPDYWFLYVAFFANELFGLVALSRLANMSIELYGKTKVEGANLVAINGVFNCCGRLIFPMASDLALRWFSNNGQRFAPATARKAVFFVALAGQLVIVSILGHLIDEQNYDGFRGVMWVLTALYGAGFGCIPAFLANMYGAANVGALHGIILTAWSIGGVGGGLGFTANYNAFKKVNIRNAYIHNFNWILAVICVGIVCLFFVRTSPEERNREGYYFTVFGKKLFHIKRRGTK